MFMFMFIFIYFGVGMGKHSVKSKAAFTIMYIHRYTIYT